MIKSPHPLIASSRCSSASFESCEDFCGIAEMYFSTGSPLVMFLERFRAIRGGFGGVKDELLKITIFLDVFFDGESIGDVAGAIPGD